MLHEGVPYPSIYPELLRMPSSCLTDDLEGQCVHLLNNSLRQENPVPQPRVPKNDYGFFHREETIRWVNQT